MVVSNYNKSEEKCMKTKLFAAIAAVFMIVSGTVCAADFVQLGECPITSDRDRSGDIVLSPLENEIYGNAVVISNEEFYSTFPYDTVNPLIPLSGSVWNGVPTEFNDGLRKELQAGYNELYGDEQQWEAYTDISGRTILTTLPGGWQRTWDYHTHYNFGFMTEACEEMYWEEYADAFGSDYNFANSAITNVFTGQVYSIDTVSIRGIDNAGNVYFTIPVLKNGEFLETCYKASLKQTAAVTVFYNGNKIPFDQVPVIENGRTLVPLRAIFETIGATVDWNAETSTVTAVKGDVSVSLTVNSTEAKKNNESVELDVPAKIVGGRTLVPVRFVSDCFDVDVQWDEVMKKVVLTGKF